MGLYDTTYIMMELGGRLLLTLIAIDILLLIGITYGNAKNRRNRSKVSSSNRRWINQTTKRRTKFDGMEVLETNNQRFSPRFGMQRARPISTDTDIQLIRAHEFNGSDRVVYNPNEGIIQPVRFDKDELSPAAEREESLSYPLSSQSVKEII